MLFVHKILCRIKIENTIYCKKQRKKSDILKKKWLFSKQRKIKIVTLYKWQNAINYNFVVKIVKNNKKTDAFASAFIIYKNVFYNSSNDIIISF